MKINRQRHRPLEVSIGGLANRDPMFSGHWYGPGDTLPSGPTAPVEVPSPQWDLAPLPPPSDPQQNDHVMRYWTWRLDRMEKRDGR